MTDHCNPEDKPAVPRVIVRRRNAPSTARRADMPVAQAHAILVSEYSHRIMLEQLNINKLFGKTYMAKHPISNNEIIMKQVNVIICNNESIITRIFEIA